METGQGIRAQIRCLGNHSVTLKPEVNGTNLPAFGKMRKGKESGNFVARFVDEFPNVVAWFLYESPELKAHTSVRDSLRAPAIIYWSVEVPGSEPGQFTWHLKAAALFFLMQKFN